MKIAGYAIVQYHILVLEYSYSSEMVCAKDGTA